MTMIRLGEFCQARSGDKADVSNIAIFAPNEETYALLVKELTAERVKRFLSAQVKGTVTRYEAPLVRGLNFVCKNALGGGAPDSLQVDVLGKTYGGNLLRLEIDMPDDMLHRLSNSMLVAR